MKRLLPRGAVSTAAVALAVGCLAIPAPSVGAASRHAANAKRSLTVLYTSNYVFDSDALAAKWWNGLARQWAARYPKVKLNLDGTGGTTIDLMNKAAVEFRSASTTPDVIQLPTTYVGAYAASGYLLPLNKYVSGRSAPAFWKGMPKGVQEMSEIGGKIYAVNAGNNDSGILYNKAMLEKAGVKMPWNPKRWNTIIKVAEAVKKADPGVWPLWLAAGVEAGPTNVLQGIGNLIDGSTSPKMYDTKTGKWVVNSPGLRATLAFYRSVFAHGLDAPTSYLFRSTAVSQPPILMAQNKVAIAFGSNWFPGTWVPGNSTAPLPKASTKIGVAPVPTEKGQPPGGASTIGGWAFAIAKSSPNAKAAWNLIKLAEAPKNQLDTALWSGFVPPDISIGKEKPFVDYAPPFQAAFNQYSKYGVPLPNNPNFDVYARALNTVTGDFALNPSTSVSTALKTLFDTVTQQLGPTSVETLK